MSAEFDESEALDELIREVQILVKGLFDSFSKDEFDFEKISKTSRYISSKNKSFRDVFDKEAGDAFLAELKILSAETSSFFDSSKNSEWKHKVHVFKLSKKKKCFDWQDVVPISELKGSEQSMELRSSLKKIRNPKTVNYSLCLRKVRDQNLKNILEYAEHLLPGSVGKSKSYCFGEPLRYFETILNTIIKILRLYKNGNEPSFFITPFEIEMKKMFREKAVFYFQGEESESFEKLFRNCLTSLVIKKRDKKDPKETKAIIQEIESFNQFDINEVSEDQLIESSLILIFNSKVLIL